MPTTSATDVPLIPCEALFGNPERAAVQLSPDGRHLSWLAPLDGVLNVFVAPVDDPSAAEPVTSDTSRGIQAYFWTYRPDTLLYLRDDGGDEDYHLHRVTLDGQEARDLTPYPQTTAQVAGLSHDRPDEVLVGMNDRDARWHDLYRIDLETGERTLVEENVDGFARYLADAEFVVRYAVRTRPDGGADVLARRGEGWERVEDIGFEDALTTEVLSLTHDGRTLYLLDSRGRDTTGLYAVPTAGGERRLVHQDARADVEDVLLHPATGQVQAAAVTYLRKEWTVVDEGVAADLERLEAGGTGEVTVLTRTLDDRTWMVMRSAAEEPGVYHLCDRDSGRVTELFRSRPALQAAPLVAMTPVEIPARDGRLLVSYLSVPAGTASGLPRRPVPMVLLVHGGPWWRDAYRFDDWVQWLANRGYAVLQVNFRGSTGFGKDFINAGDGEWGAAMHEDLVDAVGWAVEQGVTGRDQVAIMGASYGGYATLAGLTFTPDLFVCGIDVVGPSNLHTLLETIPPYWASMFEQLARRVGDPRTEEGRELLRERSPLTHADRIVRPLLIAQGANDPRVKQAESDQIVGAMQDKGIPVTYVLFPDEGHGFARPENNTAFTALAEGFLAAHLGGRVEPVGEDLTGSSLTVLTGADAVPGLTEALASHEPQLRA
ncbi:S9 family peptidase [Ornithinimicrobium cryptoxanthini]|uniref:S9 family peptidase n=1 Tax=Ornithinimicrobium cryptoxanthini TaxID=2934161 RepID=UPI0021177D21|nr:S9 family peptidase [Ornithinimicrobium cryptoxanthini]